MVNSSIRVFEYNNCPSVDKICEEIAKLKKPILKECKDKENPSETIELTTEFKLGDRFQGGISGTVEQEHQYKIKVGRTFEYPRTIVDMAFFINPDRRIIILHGPAEVRLPVKNMIREVLDAGIPDIANICIQKDKQMTFVDAILDQDSRNNKMQSATFRIRKSDNQGIKNYTLNMHPGSCVKRTQEFDELYEKAYEFKCKLSLVKYDKLINKTTETPATLSIDNNMSFSFSEDIELKQWSSFVLDRCLEMRG